MGSPRENGRSASIASQIFDACIDECPDDSISVVSVAGMEISGCIGCDLCKKVDAKGACEGEAQIGSKVGEGDDEPNGSAKLSADKADEDADPPFELEASKPVSESDSKLHQCFMQDDMRIVREHVDAADELIVVCPVYFAGAPSQFKALLDRMQPYFWSDLRKKGSRPMLLHIVGEGNDPFGFEPLVGSIRSALSVAGFALDTVYDWVGCIDRAGNIERDAQELRFDG